MGAAASGQSSPPPAALPLQVFSFVHAQVTFFHQGSDLLRDLEPTMKTMAAQVLGSGSACGAAGGAAGPDVTRRVFPPQLSQLSRDASAKRKELENTHLLVQQRVRAPMSLPVAAVPKVSGAECDPSAGTVRMRRGNRRSSRCLATATSFRVTCSNAPGGKAKPGRGTLRTGPEWTGPEWTGPDSEASPCVGVTEICVSDAGFQSETISFCTGRGTRWAAPATARSP